MLCDDRFDVLYSNEFDSRILDCVKISQCLSNGEAAQREDRTRRFLTLDGDEQLSHDPAVLTRGNVEDWSDHSYSVRAKSSISTIRNRTAGSKSRSSYVTEL
jgi:hypothetical protein